MDSGLRIVSIVPYRILPAKLGGEKGIALFNEYLAERIALTAVTTRNNDPGLAKGYRLLNMLGDSRARYINIFLYFRIRKLLLRQRATHLLIEHPYYGWLAWMLRKTTRVQWIVHSHNIEYMRSRSIGRWWWKALRAYEAWVYRQADWIFFISEDDRQHAIRELGTAAGKSREVTYGIEHAAAPADRTQSREQVGRLHGIAPEEKILLFNGALYHSTNYEALRVILDGINPHLLATTDLRYRIIVCGKGLPESFGQLQDYAGRNVVYAGFVEDIDLYFKAADIFLNPILSGGGVKTKAIEALAMDCTVVSTELGAMGINRGVCGSKLQVVSGDWKDFADVVVSCTRVNEHTPELFYAHYSWRGIINTVVDFLKQANA